MDKYDYREFWLGRVVLVKFNVYNNSNPLYGHIVGFDLNEWGETVIEIKTKKGCETISVHPGNLEVL